MLLMYLQLYLNLHVNKKGICTYGNILICSEVKYLWNIIYANHKDDNEAVNIVEYDPLIFNIYPTISEKNKHRKILNSIKLQ